MADLLEAAAVAVVVGAGVLFLAGGGGQALTSGDAGGRLVAPGRLTGPGDVTLLCRGNDKASLVFGSELEWLSRHSPIRIEMLLGSSVPRFLATVRESLDRAGVPRGQIPDERFGW